MTNPLLQAKGTNGQVELYTNKVRIIRKGFFALLAQGLKGEKEILISSISSIQFKKANAWANGYIQFAFMGGKEAQGGVLQAYIDENTVMFKTKQQADFERIKDEIDKRMQTVSASSSSLSAADEIAKLANLRDKGVLTDAEFQQRKRQLLEL